MDYLLKANGLVVLLFLFYFIFLKNETFFRSIRNYFIIGLLIVLAIPLIEIPIYVEAVTSQIDLLNYNEISSESISIKTIDWTQMLGVIYLLGVTFFSLKFLTQLSSLGILVSKHKMVKQGKLYFIETSKNIAPFSFFNIIIYNKSQFTLDELKHVINHEKAHAKQWHSIDTILTHLLLITFWFNPFVWLYKKAVQQNLEFLADAFALKLAENEKQYQLTLLKTCSTSFCTEITNNFYKSLIKKRILMLHKNRSKNKNQWKYAILLPLLIAFVSTFNTKIIAQGKKLVEIAEVNTINVDLIIDKDSSDDKLKKETIFFKKEFDIKLSFKGIKRNDNDEITTIKIDAKGKNLKATFENSGTEPIKPIKISYNSDENSISIGNLSKIHKSHYAYKIHKKGDNEFKGKPNKDSNYVFISSDGKTKTWKSKGDKSKNIELKVINKKGDKENVWIHKKDEDNTIKVEVISSKEGAHTINVIHEGEDIEFTSEQEIEIIEEDNASENVYIIKTDGNKLKKHKISKKENIVFVSSENETPLVFLDGKEITNEELKKIDADSIAKMEVLKGENAIEKYGKKAKDGVILITTKKE